MYGSTRWVQNLVLVLFPIALLTFHYRNYSITAFFMILLIIIVIFLPSESERMVIWIINAFMFGYFLTLYGLRMIENLPLTRSTTILIGEMLQTVPIIAIYYIQSMFKQKDLLGTIVPSWRKPSVKLLFHIGNTALFLAILLTLISYGSSSTYLLWGLLFSAIHATLYELLWRGVLQPVFLKTSSIPIGAIISSVSFGIYYYNFGYSISIAVGFTILGLVFYTFRLQSNSLVPSLLWHFLIILLLLLTKSLNPI